MPVVTTNLAANTATRFLNYNTTETAGSIGKLASGSRIVRASDDAAGLAIASRLNSDVVALQQAAINASQGASMVQVADGGLARIGDLLQRMNTLAIAALNGTLTNTEIGFIGAEHRQLTNEINDVAAATRFNGDSLLDGTVTDVDFFVGTDASDVITVDFSELAVGINDFTTASLGITFGIVDTLSATGAQAQASAAIDLVSEGRANLGALMSRFEYRGQQISSSLENIAAAQSAIQDIDIAAEQSRLISSQVLVEASVSALSQANQIPQTLVRVLQDIGNA